jgi:transposase
LVLNNLAAHRSREARDLMDEFCKPEFIPTYSCELNGPIETTWAILKKRVLPRWTKLLIRKDANKAKFKAIVRDELDNKIDK